MALAPGTRFGTYKIADEIGAGGMGVVYRATDTKLKRDVAIKVLPESLASDAERLARFQREAELLASLNHLNIAQIYGLEESDETTALVMELVEGPTLEDHIKQGALPADEALGIAMQIAEALKGAHGQGIVHRDLKPANIKLRPDGTVKVLDFGIAKALEPESLTTEPQSPMLTTPATQVGVILGTAAYMSPEQARGMQVDQRADIWAFGCVLYEMLTGQPAFAGEDVTITLARIAIDDTDFDSLPAGISPAVRHTIKLCLEKDVDKRLHAIGDVRLALEGAFETAPSQAAETAATSLPLWRRALPISAAVLITGFFVGFGGELLRPEPEQPPVNRFDYELPADQTFGNPFRRVFALSPDGRHFVYSASGGLHLRTMSDLEARLLQGTEQEVTSPFFSPDGQSVVYEDRNSGQLKRISITGGAPVVITDIEQNVRGLSWQADGTILYGLPEGINRVSANGGTPELIVPAEDDKQFYGFELLPDGDTLLFSVGLQEDWDSAQIVAQSLSTGDRTVLVEGGSDARYLPTGHLIYALGDGLFAVAFDAETLAVSGGAVPLIQGVARAAGVQSATANYGISADGTLAYVVETTTGAESSLVWVDREGREEPIPIAPSSYAYPRISPDGSRVALDDRNVGGDLWVWDLVGETRTRLTVGDNGASYPAWTSDGLRLAYGLPTAGDIGWKAANNTGRPEVLVTDVVRSGSLNPNPYFFSIAGTELVFREQQNSETGDNIGMIEIGSDADPVWLLQEPYNERNAELSPDGNWMAYQSDESSQFEIYVRPFPNVDDNRWQISNAGGVTPVWSRDGQELFYLEPGQPVRLMAVPVQADETAFSPGARQRVFDWPYRSGLLGPPGRSYDVSPDGRFLAISERGTDGQPAQIVIVQNWFEELNRLAPPSQ